jgi:ubiquinone/menaquinone biosynthesis C-methylase UbiE
MYAKTCLPEELFYDNIADKYDGEYNYNLALAENKFITDLIKDEKIHHGKVLDLGCGTGLFLDYIRKGSNDYCGIDISVNMLNKMKEKHPRHETIKMNITDIEGNFSEMSFDNVVSLFGSLAYVEDIPKAIEGIYRVLKPGGKFFLMVPTQKYITRKNFIGNKFSSDIKLATYNSSCIAESFSKFSKVKTTGFNLFVESMNEKYSTRFYNACLNLEKKLFGSLFPFQHYYLLISGTK